jgi:hypothetical protein
MTLITIKIFWIFWILIWNINKKLWISCLIINQTIIVINVLNICGLQLSTTLLVTNGILNEYSWMVNPTHM